MNVAVTVFAASIVTVHSSGVPGTGVQFAEKLSKSEFASGLAVSVTTVPAG